MVFVSVSVSYLRRKATRCAKREPDFAMENMIEFGMYRSTYKLYYYFNSIQFATEGVLLRLIVVVVVDDDAFFHVVLHFPITSPVVSTELD
jgi:hypothetical protein